MATFSGDVSLSRTWPIDWQAFLGRRGWHHELGPLIDGGIVNVPESAWQGRMGMDYRGLRRRSDIEVDNDPQSVIAGKDRQLERAIAEVMVKLKSPVKLPPKPAGPVKTIDRRQTSKATEQGKK